MSVKTILENHNVIRSQNARWRDYFRDLADFCIPRKANQDTIRHKGDRVDFNFLYDSTAILSVQTMVSGIQSHLTNESAKWFSITPRNRKLIQDKTNAIYFHDTTEAMHELLGQTNFYRITKEFYQDCGVFGTSPIFSERDFGAGVRFRSIPIHEFDMEEDTTGRVIAAYWSFTLTAMQAFRLWGDKAGKTVKEMVTSADKKYGNVDFVFYVGPRNERDTTKLDQLNMPYKSCWIAKKDEHLIDEGGFEDFPFHVGRWWKPNDDCFGYSPAMNALAEIKLRNAMKKTALRRAMKETDPPLDVPSKGYVLPLNLNPAAMNYRDAKLGKDDGVRAFGVGAGSFEISKEMMTEVKDAIEQSFFVPLFRAFSMVTKQMTVPEVQERIREGMVLLGPVVGDFFEDVFSPLLIRSFNLWNERGWLPEAPESLQGEAFDPIPTSTLARVQRESEANNIRGFIVEVGEYSKVIPSALDKINADSAIDIISRIRALDPRIIRSDAEVEAIRNQRAQAEAQAAQMDMMHKGAEIVRTGSEAEKNMKAAA